MTLGQYKEGICAGCESPALIVFKRGELCNVCNQERLSKRYRENAEKRDGSVNRTKPLRAISKKGRGVVREDERTYELVWGSRTHNCEECGIYLGDRFRDDNGKVIDRFRYSHILTKGAHPELRHNVMNFNLLCLKHHAMWENGNKKGMKIYAKNQKIIERILWKG